MRKHGEEAIEKQLKDVLKRFPIYGWLKEQKGVATISSAWLIGEFNIYKADTVSKLWQFSGMNPGKVRGRISVRKKDYKLSMGTIVRKLTDFITKEERVEVLTDVMIRGDKTTKGFLSPFNKRLRVALVGVLASSFVRSQAYYAMTYYYPYKERLENSDKIVEETKKGGRVVEVAWKDATKGHRDAAARRKMIKEFLKDLYVAWRNIEGLSVRVPYAEEYLGKTIAITNIDGEWKILAHSSNEDEVFTQLKEIYDRDKLDKKYKIRFRKF